MTLTGLRLSQSYDLARSIVRGRGKKSSDSYKEENQLKKLLLAAVLMGLLLVSVTAYADVVVGTGAAGWQAFSAPNNDGNPYWDRLSKDGANKNIGFLLNSIGESPNWWGNADGSADANFYFNHTAPSNKLVATLNWEVAGDKGINEFGWYDADTGNAWTLFTLFPGSAVPGDSVTFSLGSVVNYGFYLKGRWGTFFTESSKNTTNVGYQHFAAFGTGKSYWIGAEDLLFPSTDGDFNDAIVKVETVPEPSSLLVLASSSMGALGYLIRRRRNG